jgi:hypothetical protein
MSARGLTRLAGKRGVPCPPAEQPEGGQCRPSVFPGICPRYRHRGEIASPTRCALRFPWPGWRLGSDRGETWVVIKSNLEERSLEPGRRRPEPLLQDEAFGGALVVGVDLASKRSHPRGFPPRPPRYSGEYTTVFPSITPLAPRY